MYGVPANLDLKFLHGAELTLVGLGLYQIYLHFHPEGLITIEGDWELRDNTDSLIDRDSWGPGREPYQLHKLLGRCVKATEVAAPKCFALFFDNEYMLRVFDNSPAYESFSIQPGNIFV
jgi:hypothetical protein